jgi:hypothetical protein
MYKIKGKKRRTRSFLFPISVRREKRKEKERKEDNWTNKAEKKRRVEKKRGK